MKICETVFWISLLVIFYTYIGYGMLLYVLVRLKECFRQTPPPPLPADCMLPELTLFITAYNEEDAVDDKMRNSLSLDYPADKLHILWITDGSNDRTNERLSHWPQATVLYQPQREGKTAALNRGIRFVTTPLVVFTDANTHLNREALREIVRAFANPKVGCVAGEKRIAVQDKDNAASGGEGLYWKYESALKKLDSRLYSAVGAAGELFAIRRELYEEMSADTLLDDFTLSLRFGRHARRRKTQSAYRCRRLAVRLASACIAQSAALRYVFFSIHIPPRTEMVAYARTVVPAVPPQYDSHFYVKHPSALCRHLAAASTVLLHGELGALPVSKTYQE